MAPRDDLRDAIRRYQESRPDEDWDEDSRVDVHVHVPPVHIPPVVQGPLPETVPPTSMFAGRRGKVAKTAAALGGVVAVVEAVRRLLELLGQ